MSKIKLTDYDPQIEQEFLSEWVNLIKNIDPIEAINYEELRRIIKQDLRIQKMQRLME